MLPYTNRARTQDTSENFELARSCTYDLLSVVVHVGKLNSGELREQMGIDHKINVLRPLYFIFESRKSSTCATLG